MLIRAILFLLLCVAQASAETLYYSESGVWGPDVTPNAWVAPNTPWSFSFQTESDQVWSNLTVSYVQDFCVPQYPCPPLPPGYSFDIPTFSNWTYSLGGSLVPIQPIAMRVLDIPLPFNNAPFYSLSIYFQRDPLDPSRPYTFNGYPPVGFILNPDPADRLYDAPGNYPHLLTGEFPMVGEFQDIYCQCPDAIAGEIQDSTLHVTPEPNSFVLAATGLAAGYFGSFGVLFRRRSRKS